MVDPRDLDLYLDGVKRSVETAERLGVKNLFLMSDIMKEDRSVLEPPYTLSKEEKMEASARVLRELIPIARREQNYLCD